MNDDDEFLPYEEDSDEDEQVQADDIEPGVEEHDDDEAYLRGQTDIESDSGWETGTEADAGISDTDAGLTSGAETDAEEDIDLFPAGTDPMAMLQGMEQNRNDDQSQQLQPYELLARQRRLNKNRNQSATVVNTCFTGFHCVAIIQ